MLRRDLAAIEAGETRIVRLFRVCPAAIELTCNNAIKATAVLRTTARLITVATSHL